MPDPKRILILTADVGFGHRIAANAIQAALADAYGDRCLVEIVNPLDDDRTPAILRDSQTDYDRLVREMPDIYKIRYQISDNPLPNTIMESAVTVMLFKVIQDLVQRHKPDVVVSTHPMYPAPLSAVIAVSKKNTPHLTVVTDLTQVHRMWFNPAADLCFVPTEDARQTALENHIQENKVIITGIPVHPEILMEDRPKEVLRAELGWRPDLTTVLVAGSKRVNHLQGVLHILNHSGLPIQLAIIAGGDDELFAQLQATEWHGMTHLYNFVDNMSTLMRASDCIISKAGGLIVAEALACGLPLLLVDVTPGQEEGNAKYVLKNGAAEKAKTPVDALETLCHWLVGEQAVLKQRAEKAAALGRPRSAYTIADFIWAAAERGPLPIPETTLKLMPKLIEFLNRFGIVGDEPQPA